MSLATLYFIRKGIRCLSIYAKLAYFETLPFQTFVHYPWDFEIAGSAVLQSNGY